MRYKFLLGATIVTAFSALLPLPATAYTPISDPGGNGFVSGVTATGFTLTGTDFASGDPLGGLSYIDSYVDTAPYDLLVSFDWSFANNDTAGPSFDAAGFVVDGNTTILSDTGAANSSGTETFAVLAGQAYGWFAYTLDAQNGAGVLTVSNIGIPEPMSLLLLGSACSALGFARRRGVKPA